MKFGFVTCVQLGLSCLETIRELGSEPDLLVTLHDDIAEKKSGRVWLDGYAAKGNNRLVKVKNINDQDSRFAIAAAQLDWLFVIGWSQIVGEEVLRLPRLGCVGMHPTLLPEGRGRASIPWAIIKGLPQTGVTLFALDTGIDTGPVIAQQEVPIEADETASTLYTKVDLAHVALVRDTWDMFRSGSVNLVTQDDSRATEWPGRRPEDGQLTPSMTVKEMDRHVRALAPPYPGAWWTDALGRQWSIAARSTTVDTSPALDIPAADGTYRATVVRPAEDRV